MDEGAVGKLSFADLPNRVMLVGITYCDATGKPVRQLQVHGVVMVADLDRGIQLVIKGQDEPYTLPPDLTGIRRADPGVYALRASGETVENPDFLGQWTVYMRPNAAP